MLLSAPLVDQFYRTRHGGAAAALLRERLSLLWPALRGMTVLGLGHARPYLPLWATEARACFDLAASRPVSGAWSPDGRGRSVVADGDMLPFPDLSIDRILLVHGLEVAANAQRLLRECWRVLRDDGRLLLVTPNRAGLWAHLEATPFGQGEPYTQGQVERLLRSGLFAVERRDTALYMPPFDIGLLIRGAALTDRVGRALVPRLAGVGIAEAVKDVYAAMPVEVARSRFARPATGRVLMPLAAGRALPTGAAAEGGASSPVA